MTDGIPGDELESREDAKRPVERLVIWLWSVVWSRWLIDCKGSKMTVVKVKGWRTAIVESRCESRKTITPCFAILGYKFD